MSRLAEIESSVVYDQRLSLAHRRIELRQIWTEQQVRDFRQGELGDCPNQALLARRGRSHLSVHNETKALREMRRGSCQARRDSVVNLGFRVVVRWSS